MSAPSIVTVIADNQLDNAMSLKALGGCTSFRLARSTKNK